MRAVCCNRALIQSGVKPRALQNAQRRLERVNGARVDRLKCALVTPAARWGQRRPICRNFHE